MAVLASKAFNHWGLDLQLKGDQLIGNCPFCYAGQKTPKTTFYAHPTSGQWDCKSCGLSGNIHNFLSEFHRLCLESTNAGDYEKFAELFGLPAEAAAFCELALDGNHWMIPVRNQNGTMIDLRSIEVSRGKDGKPQLGKSRSTAGCNTGLFRADKISARGPIYICEGEKDAISLNWLFRKAGKRLSVVAVPGANSFKPSWAELFQYREVVLLYDNDRAGEEGMRMQAVPRLAEARSIRKVVWPGTLPTGYDITDFILENKKRYRKAFGELHALTESVNSLGDPLQNGTFGTAGKPISFKTLITNYKKYLYMTPAMRDTLAVICATILSTQIPGDPLWLFVVGPSGSGKGILTTFKKTELCVFRSSLSPKELVSGFIRSGTDEDFSLLPKLRNKTLIAKDFTELLTLPNSDQEQIFGTLRGAYDGHVHRSYGHGLERDYKDTHFSIVAGVTDIIHAHNKTELGERFLKVDCALGADSELQIRSAIANAKAMINAEQELEGTAQRFVEKVVDLKKLPRITKPFEDRIVALSQLVAALRLSVSRDRGGNLDYRPRAEIGTRLAKQLTKLCQGLCLVFGKSTVDSSIFKIVLRVSRDTATGWNLDIAAVLAKREQGLPAVKISQVARISDTSTHRKLENMLEIGVVNRSENVSAGPGRNEYVYKLDSFYLNLWKKAGL